MLKLLYTVYLLKVSPAYWTAKTCDHFMAIAQVGLYYNNWK